MSGYLGLVTSEHRNRPRFMATVAAVTDPLCGLQELLETMRAAFDVDSAVGGQLDRTGEWSRHLRLELDDVYFEWGREAVGWARGSWKGLYDPETGMVRLPDETYRLLLKAKIGANRWDGTVPGAYEVWESAFADTGSLILMQDNQDMSVVIGLAAVVIGEAVVRHISPNFAVRLTGVAIGAVIYYLVYQTVIFLGFDADLLKMFSAVVVALFLGIPYLQKTVREACHTSKAAKGGNNHA